MKWVFSNHKLLAINQITYPIHLVDNGGVGVGKVSTADMGSTNDGEVVQVFGDDGEWTSSESGGSVVHERAVIVRHAESGGSADFVEVVSETESMNRY